MSISYVVGVDLGKSQDFTATSIIAIAEPEPPPPLMTVTDGPEGRSYQYDPQAYKEYRKPAHADLPARLYHVRRLERFQLGARYTEYCERIVRMVSTKPLIGCPLVVDWTGVGQAAVDMIHKLLVLYQSAREVDCPKCKGNACAECSWSGKMKQGGISRTRLVPILITGGVNVTPVEGGWHVPKKELVGNLDSLIGTRRLIIEPGCGVKDEDKVLQNEFGSFNYKITKVGNETFEARSGEHDDLVLSVSLALWWAERGTKFWVR